MWTNHSSKLNKLPLKAPHSWQRREDTTVTQKHSFSYQNRSNSRSKHWSLSWLSYQRPSHLLKTKGSFGYQGKYHSENKTLHAETMCKLFPDTERHPQAVWLLPRSHCNSRHMPICRTGIPVATAPFRIRPLKMHFLIEYGTWRFDRFVKRYSKSLETARQFGMSLVHVQTSYFTKILTLPSDTHPRSPSWKTQQLATETSEHRIPSLKVDIFSKISALRSIIGVFICKWPYDAIV